MISWEPILDNNTRPKTLPNIEDKQHNNSPKDNQMKKIKKQTNKMDYFGSILGQIERRMKLSHKQDTLFLDAKMM